MTAFRAASICRLRSAVIAGAAVASLGGPLASIDAQGPLRHSVTWALNPPNAVARSSDARGGDANESGATVTARPAQLARIPLPAPRREWSTIGVAKWALLAAAVGLGAYALSSSARADDAYERLRDICAADSQRCEISGGRYLDERAESLYQLSQDRDRHARVGIFGGQAALLGSVGLFVYELRRSDPEPENIPYPVPPPEESGDTSARGSGRVAVGVSLAY
ncbi:MAG: hypothetical protein ACRENI_11940 [Gemmatimonadaceae bacterium]